MAVFGPSSLPAPSTGYKDYSSLLGSVINQGQEPFQGGQGNLINAFRQAQANATGQLPGGFDTGVMGNSTVPSLGNSPQGVPARPSLGAPQAPQGAPQSQDQGQQSYLPQQLGMGFSGGKMGLNLLNSINKFLPADYQVPGFGAAAGAGSGLLGLGQGALQISQGNPVGGSIGALQGTNYLTQAAAPYLANAGYISPATANALGGAGSVAGPLLGAAMMGYGLSQGTQAGDRQAVSAAGPAAFSLAGTIGGSALAGLGGAGATLLGAIVENATNAALGEGPYGKTKLPFGRSIAHPFSSAENLASQISRYTGIKGANQIAGGIGSAQTPKDLLSMATAEQGLSPHGEIQFSHVTAGHGGDQMTAASPSYKALVAKAATGDPAALRDFISGVHIQSGETGATSNNWMLTDQFRRKLVSMLPENHPVRQNLEGLFEPMPEDFSLARHQSGLQGAMGNAGFQNDPQAILSGRTSPFGSADIPTLNLSPYFRDLSPYEAITKMMTEQGLQRVRQTPAVSPAQYTPENQATSNLGL